MSNGTLKGAWNYITAVCGKHGDDYSNPMKLHSTETKIYYSCPKCGKMNEIPYWVYENMLTEISNVLVKAEMNDSVVNLLNYEWRKNGVRFKVVSCSDQRIIVSLVNTK